MWILDKGFLIVIKVKLNGMIKRWISWINFALAAVGTALLLMSLWFLFSRPSEIFLGKVQEEKTTLPKRAFALPENAYAEIEKQLELQFTPMSIQLPDLRRFLIYYGKNGRPDANQKGILLHFGLNGIKESAAIAENQKLYLIYDRSSSPGKYIFSPNNSPTPLWVEPRVSGDEVTVHVGILDEKGNLIQEPALNAQFNLKGREFVRAGSNWEIGNQRVDGTLLARQKTRWFGKDKFMERHGGEEYRDFIGKERLDFGEGSDMYSVYVSLGDTLIWEGNHWKVVKPGKDSLGHPLLVVKQIDDRLMKFELWDVEGRGSIALNLLKSLEPKGAQNLTKNFKFLGARTRSQFVFEIDNERVLLSPYDWLLYTDGNWKKLTTAQEIDDYVDRKIIGPLFVFDGIRKIGDQQVLSGALFNSTRSDFQAIELPVQQSGGSPIKDEAKGTAEGNAQLKQNADGKRPNAPVKQVQGTNESKENATE